MGLYRRLFQHPETPIQERRVALTPGEWHKIKVVVQDKFIDVYVNDELNIVRAHRSFEDGCFGLHARGLVAFRNVHAYEYLGLDRLPGRDWRHFSKPRHLFPDTQATHESTQ